MLLCRAENFALPKVTPHRKAMILIAPAPIYTDARFILLSRWRSFESAGCQVLCVVAQTGTPTLAFVGRQTPKFVV